MIIRKIAIRAGHNAQAQGSIGLLNEVDETRVILPYVITYLQRLGCAVIDVTPGNCDVNTDLYYGVNRSNIYKSDYFCSIHLNAFNGQGHGCETLYCPGSKEGKLIAERITTNLALLGFTHRGAKEGVREGVTLYELRKTDCPANIIECFFLDNAADVELYKSIGAEAIGKAIATAICNTVYDEPLKKINSYESSSKGIIAELQLFLNSLGYRGKNNLELDVDNISGLNTRYSFNNLSNDVNRGKNVLSVQKFLNEHNYRYNGALLVEDGLIGPKTRTCLEALGKQVY